MGQREFPGRLSRATILESHDRFAFCEIRAAPAEMYSEFGLPTVVHDFNLRGSILPLKRFSFPGRCDACKPHTYIVGKQKSYFEVLLGEAEVPMGIGVLVRNASDFSLMFRMRLKTGRE